ncbi:MAG: Y-family DNA polymerase [Candidatus Caenarcaniphilales bacterium]|nr:Y-family DNA polymerase [Candidatus Caenarcaniphilales bacterium]
MQSTKQIKYFAIVDCNSFYVSCERVFNPSLKNVPVVILSNNDGCIVSRSQEVKEIGIPAGMPLFKCERDIKASNTKVFSSNYTLYADMSKRVMDTIAHLVPEIEVYSIDEAFFQVMGDHQEIKEKIKQVRETILQWTGIPTSIGVGKTKTLAKVANHIAKKEKGTNGTYCLFDNKQAELVLRDLPVQEVWGVGRRIAEKLIRRRITTALGLAKSNDRWIKEQFTVVGLKIVNELRGIPCYDLEQVPQPRKNIVSSRSFGYPVIEQKDLEEAIATYTARAAEKMRKQESVTQYIYIYITTNRFQPNSKQYYNSISVKLPSQTDYSPTLIHYALKGLRTIYKPGFQYKKAGVMLSFLVPKPEMQINLFDSYDTEKQTNVMKVFDRLNNRYGHNIMKVASEGLKKGWIMKSDYKSNKYTTDWNEIPVVS